MRRYSFLFLIPLLALVSCHSKTHLIEPSISYSPQKRHIRKLEKPFQILTPTEAETLWGKEITIANAFAKDLDLYRAITSFKRARMLCPKENKERILQIDYSILLSYYLGNKWCEVIETFETTNLREAPEDFPPFRDLLIIIYDSYQAIGECDKACAILKLLENYDAESACNLNLYSAIKTADLVKIRSSSNEVVSCWMNQYCQCAKSPGKAQMLNAMLPGAGYLYVGQKQTALTSFLLNSLFIAASWRFFERGHIAAGIITSSLETGWYIGGINGAGLAAKTYNQRLYSDSAKEILLCERLFPVIMLNYSF